MDRYVTVHMCQLTLLTLNVKLVAACTACWTRASVTAGRCQCLGVSV